MNSQKAALLSRLVRRRHLADRRVGTLVKYSAIVLMVSLILPVQAATAERINETELYQMGNQVCQTALDDGPSEMLGGIDCRNQ